MLNLTTAIGLLRAVFFYNGKNFCLRGGQEQRNLKLSQIHKETGTVDGRQLSLYVYCEFGSKNRQGGLSSLNLQNKVVHQYKNTTGSGVCHVKILDKYLQVLPPEAGDKDVFYLTPLPKVPTDSSKPWFKTVPVGKNRLNTMLKEMCAEAGIAANYTNHSLRAYGATTMFQAGVSEKLIKQQTGHNSVESLRQYECASESQLLDVSNIVSFNQNPSPRDFEMLSVMKSHSQQSYQSASYKADEMVSYSSRTEPPKPTFIFNSCNFSSCSMNFAMNNDSEPSKKSDELDNLLQGITVEELFDC